MVLLGNVEAALMIHYDPETAQLERLDERMQSCEQSLARIDERTEIMYTFGMKAYKFGVALAALVLGVDIAPLLGVV